MTIAALLLALIATAAVDGPDSGPADRGGPVLLDFHSDSCPPCRAMRPGIAQLVKAGYPVKSINLDRQPEMGGRYKVQAVPTFVVVDGDGNEIDRTSGYQPATNLATMFREAKARIADDTPSRPRTVPVSDPGDDPPADEPSDEDRPALARTRPNPDPWETVVRIRMRLNGSAEGIGSGTIIYSDDTQAIILTCAHIFKDHGRETPPPSRYRTPIAVDLFDGQRGGPRRNQVHFLETVKGEAIDYDLLNDVGLIRIRPGRVLPASKVVPPYWTPQETMHMIAVGCSEGREATAYDTLIVSAEARLQNERGETFPMIACDVAPKQGRSGGGLYTDNGYVAGVCDFADPHNGRGLYAVPKSIYKILDKNRMTALYEPAGSRGVDTPGRMLASDEARPKGDRGRATVRTQSPVEDEGWQVPPPDRFGIAPPTVASNGKGNAWSRPGAGRGSAGDANRAVAAGMKRQGDDDQPESVGDGVQDLDAPAIRIGKNATWKPVRPTLNQP